MHVLLLPPITTLLIVCMSIWSGSTELAPRPETRRCRQRILSAASVQGHGGDLRRLRDSLRWRCGAHPVERIADPTDTTYVPRPEWYFLFLFQNLEAVRSGPLEVLAASCCRAAMLGASAGSVHRPQHDGKGFPSVPSAIAFAGLAMLDGRA